MAAITSDRSLGVVPVPRLAALVLLLAVAALWLVTFENGELMGQLGRASALLHETFHDGRHLLGVPCH